MLYKKKSEKAIAVSDNPHTKDQNTKEIKDLTVKFINNLQSKIIIERKIESKNATTFLFFRKLQLSKVGE